MSNDEPLKNVTENCINCNIMHFILDESKTNGTNKVYKKKKYVRIKKGD